MSGSLRIGVVIPVYNNRTQVLRALSSVLHQTHEDWSLVVVDDGSTDGGGDLVEAVDDPRVGLLRTANEGPGSARNRGARALETDWIGFLDADDEWHPEFLARTAEAASRECGAVAIYTAVSGHAACGVSEGVVSDYYGLMLRERIAMTSSSVLLNRENLLRVGGFVANRTYAEDTETWFRLVCSGVAYVIPEPLAVLHETPLSLSRDVSHAEKAQALGDLIATYEDFRRSDRVPSSLRTSARMFMDTMAACRAEHVILDGDKAKGLAMLLTEVRLRGHTREVYLACLRSLVKAIVEPYALGLRKIRKS